MKRINKNELKLDERMVAKWFADGGDDKFRYNYNLTEQSIVIDAGGYKGNFSKKIHDMYNCRVFVYEPYAPFFEHIKNEYGYIDSISVHQLAISDKTGEKKLLDLGEATSVSTQNGDIKIDTIDIVDMINENNFTCVDLLKLNIEGEEYSVLERLIETDNLHIFKNIQVQFHDFFYVDQPIERRDFIREQLCKTHRETYCYPFVWESWTVNE